MSSLFQFLFSFFPSSENHASIGNKPDRLLAASGVQLAPTNPDHFHYRRAAFYSQLKSKVGNILVKDVTRRINTS